MSTTAKIGEPAGPSLPKCPTGIQGLDESTGGGLPLRRSEERYRSLVQAAAQIVWASDPRGDVVEDSPSWRAFTGQTFEEWRGRGWLNALHPEDRERTLVVWLHAIATRTRYDIEYRLRRKEGEYREVAVRGVPILADDGSIREWVGTCTDVTERKRAEEAPRRANAYNRNLIEASLDPLVTIGPEGRITDVNAATEAVTGRSRQELIGTDFADYFTEPDRARAGYEQVFREGQVRDYALEISHRDGHVTPVLYNASVYRDEAGQVIGIFAAARDVTERRRAEAEARTLNAELEQRIRERTAELEAANKELEAFAYSVSHDLRAPLRGIDGFSRILLKECLPHLPEQPRHYLQMVCNNARQMGQLIDDLLRFSRTSRQSFLKQRVGTTGLVRQCLEELRPEQEGRKVEVSVGELSDCLGDPALLKQVWLNLLTNALKFTRQRETAHVEVDCRDRDGETVYFVRDNGVGFDMQYADKLFGVFQRLHRPEDYEGTGIGLALVQRILHRHGGRAWAEARPDQGATFCFTLGRSNTCA